ncbi:MAG: response regulator [Bacilli bacterium]|nr:response regulator [Bacilli bacterium]
MNTNEYIKYIEELIPTTFEDIFAIDMLSDLVTEYMYEDRKLVVKTTTPFTSFFAHMEELIHPDDIKGYIDSISGNLDEDHIRYEYRKKMPDGEYSWHSNIIKVVDVNLRKIAIVLASEVNDNIVSKEKDSPELKQNQSVMINAVSNAIIKLNNVMNMNYSNDNAELKSMTTYVNNIISDLTTTFPEFNNALTANIIAGANQGTTKTILVVDDDAVTCKLLAKTFEDTYKIITASNGQEAISVLEINNDINTLEEKDKIVGIFLDLNMPIVDGFGVLDYMSSKNLLSKIPVIIISGDYDQETKERAYLYPIADVLEKPFNVQVIKHRIKNFIKLYKANNSLNEIILNQHQDIKYILKTIVKSYLYDYSYDIKQVTSYVNILTRQLVKDHPEYKFDEERIKKLTEASKYYNVGLYTLPHKMFKKQNFNADEIKIIKSHPNIGKIIFNSVLYKNMDGAFNHLTKEIITSHEERYDGTGYPQGLTGDKTPISAQIVSVAIEYTELLKVMNESSVLEEIIKGSGTKFNPKIVESLKNCIEDIRKVNSTM